MVPMPPPTPEQSGSRRRRLRAVMAADVANFTGLVSVDETNTLEAIWTTRKIAQEELAIHGGWLFGLPGDGIFALFESAIDAVQCALQTQARIKTAPGLGALRLRVGVHLGEVLFQDDLPFGEALVIASRLESLAEPGTILISSSVMEAVAPRISADFAEKGVVSLKHSPRRIATFTVAARSPHSEDEATGTGHALDHNTLVQPTREPPPEVTREPLPAASRAPAPALEPRPQSAPEPVPSKPLPSFGSNLLSALAAAARGGWEAARGPSGSRSEEAAPPPPAAGRAPGPSAPAPEGSASPASRVAATPVQPVSREPEPPVRLPPATPWPFPAGARSDEPGPPARDPLAAAPVLPPAAAVPRPVDRPALQPSVGIFGPRAERALDLLEASSPVFLDDRGLSADQAGNDDTDAAGPTDATGMDELVDLSRPHAAFDVSGLGGSAGRAGSERQREAGTPVPDAAGSVLGVSDGSDARIAPEGAPGESAPAELLPVDPTGLPSTGSRAGIMDGGERSPVEDGSSPLAGTALDETADFEDDLDEEIEGDDRDGSADLDHDEDGSADHDGEEYEDGDEDGTSGLGPETVAAPVGGPIGSGGGADAAAQSAAPQHNDDRYAAAGIGDAGPGDEIGHVSDTRDESGLRDERIR